jgi:endonuclease/exonuclease/phosphatase family metal-dependent hydrolase
MLRIATWNVHGGVGADRRYDPDRVTAVLRELEAEVIALQEVPLGGFGARDLIADLTMPDGWTFATGPTLDTATRRYGNAVLSRYPIDAVRSIDLSFGRREPRGALDADIVCRGRRLRVVATHLGLAAAERRAQVRRLLAAFDTDTMPVVLLGDLNEWYLRGRPLRWLRSHFGVARPVRSFPSRLPLLALDRIWMHPLERLVEVRAHRSPITRRASDHLPVIARIDWP